MTQVGIAVVGGERVAYDFRSSGEQSTAQVRSIVRHYGQILRTRVMRNASGRPGPNAPTGDYRRSIQVQMSGNSTSSTAIVGTNAPQGARLEFGFHGADSLGRVYNQPPLPHFGPAVDETGPEFVKALGSLIEGLNATGFRRQNGG